MTVMDTDLSPRLAWPVDNSHARLDRHCDVGNMNARLKCTVAKPARQFDHAMQI